MSDLLLMFAEFFKTGLFAVGGGLATLPFLYDLAARHGWFSAEELTNMIAVAESTPGPIGINVATYAGYTTHGITGALVTTAGLVLPSFLVMLLVAVSLQKIAEHPLTKSVFAYLRPAVVGLIAAATWQVISLALFSFDRFVPGNTASLSAVFLPLPLLLFAALLFAHFKWKPHPILLIAVGAAVGIIFKL